MPTERFDNAKTNVSFGASLTDPSQLITAYFKSTTIGICILDSDFRYLSINDTLARMNGLPAADHVGRSVREVLGDAADRIEPQLKRVIANGEPILNLESSATVPRRKEEVHWTEHCLPIQDAAGNVTRIAVIAVETTEKKKLQEAVQALDKKLHREAERLQTLLYVSSLLSSNWDVPLVFPRISARIRRVLHQEFAAYALRDGQTGALLRKALDFPLSKGLISYNPINTTTSPAGYAFEKSVPMIFSKEEMQSYEGEPAKSLVAEGLQSLCCLPLQRPAGPMGVFVVGSTRKNAFRQEDLTLLSQVAAQLALAIENHQAATEIGQLKQRLGEERKYLETERKPEGKFVEIIGNSTALHQVLDQAATVSESDATVLILGETGTGKELVARAIHRLSKRKDGPFIKLNCAAIPTGLLESELFGHERGSFTGAISQKVGRMELANGGSLFLDEVGEIPLELQPKLLRVLQDQEFERIGSNHTIHVDVRLIAATNRNLGESMAHREFRSDLYYRLSVFPLIVPPLRERREDIPLLIRHFVQKFAKRLNRQIESIPKETVKALTEWKWPGNIRELENLMERSVILTEGPALRVPLSELRGHSVVSAPSDHTLDQAERRHIVRILREAKGVISGPNGAARRLGLKRTTLQSKMRRLKISREDYDESSKD